MGNFALTWADPDLEGIAQLRLVIDGLRTDHRDPLPDDQPPAQA
ncbi:hypothetical protein [Lentzea fradiae]|nr:hypothetical protein [Lentzea fradiae]